MQPGESRHPARCGDAMFESLLKMLFGAEPNRAGPVLQADEAQLAQAALMFHVIAADGIVTAGERSRLETALARGFGLDAAQAAELVEAARRADAEAVDLYSFTRTLKRDLDAEARLELIRRLWQMVYADGDVHEFEDNIVWRVAELLDVDARARMEIKQRVRSEEGNA